MSWAHSDFCVKLCLWDLEGKSNLWNLCEDDSSIVLVRDSSGLSCLVVEGEVRWNECSCLLVHRVLCDGKTGSWYWEEVAERRLGFSCDWLWLVSVNVQYRRGELRSMRMSSCHCGDGKLGLRFEQLERWRMGSSQGRNTLRSAESNCHLLR